MSCRFEFRAVILLLGKFLNKFWWNTGKAIIHTHIILLYCVYECMLWNFEVLIGDFVEQVRNRSF